MKTLTTLTAVAVALCAPGCEAIVLEKGKKPSTQQISTLEPTVNPYEPDGGGQNMTPSAPQYISYHTIYPAGDVDFRYMESVGAYTVTIWSWRAPLRVRVWTRASRAPRAEHAGRRQPGGRRPARQHPLHADHGAGLRGRPRGGRPGRN